MFGLNKGDNEKETEKWMRKAKCKNLNPSIFFPSDGAGVEVARRICRDCQVKKECLEYALAHHIDHGVWGGTSERERRRILKARKVTNQEVFN